MAVTEGIVIVGACPEAGRIALAARSGYLL